MIKNITKIIKYSIQQDDIKILSTQNMFDNTMKSQV